MKFVDVRRLVVNYLTTDKYIDVEMGILKNYLEMVHIVDNRFCNVQQI